MTREHVFSSKWLESLMPSATTFTSEFLRVDETGKTDRRTWTRKKSKAERAGGPVVKCACASCNNGWMHALDEGIKPVITPLALGERGTVSRKGVEILAIWATKIALVLDSTLNPPALAGELKRAFREQPQLLPEATIWATAMSPVDERVRARVSTLGPSPGTAGLQGYVATFGVLHLALQLLRPPSQYRQVRRGPSFQKFLEPIWPRGKKLFWPPPESNWITSEDEFENLASAFEGSLT